MARELARLQHLHGASLEVTDEQGNLLSKKAIQPPFAPEQIDLKRHDNGDGGLALWGRGPFEIQALKQTCRVGKPASLYA